MTEKRPFNWKSGIFLITYQIILLIALPFYFYYHPPSGAMIGVTIILLYMTGISITGGYHRLYAHRTYRAHPIVECVILFLGAMSVQSSAMRWAFDHRLHHAYVDTDDDPYSIQKGVWYAHFMWMMEKPLPIDPKVVPDLMKNKYVAFQQKHIDKLMIGSNLLVFGLVGFFLQDFLGAFVMAVWFRIFLLHHFTWFINSLAHTWGDKPFSQEQSAVDNYILSMLTFGEGYHNYHHTFANDYRNGVRWYHYDPTKWIIWTLHKLGLVRDLKKMSPYAIKKKMVLEHKNLLMEQIKDYWHVKSDELEKQVNEMSDRIVAKISDFSQLKDKYQKMKQNKSDQAHAVRMELKTLKKSMREDWRQWSALSNSILKRRPLPQA
jgi:stearoyl-CoA desaturase (Delta-9 desaturase)